MLDTGDKCPIAFGNWFARRLVIGQLPSTHSKNKKYRVVLQYMPKSWDLPDGFENRFGFTQDGLNRLLGWWCECRVGSRMLGACGHATALVAMLFVFAFDPTMFKTRHTEQNMFKTPQNPSLNRKMLRP